MKPNKNKPPKKGVAPVKAAPVKSGTSKKENGGTTFFRFIFFDKTNRLFLIAAIIIAVIYAVTLKLLFPQPNFYLDSATYIDVAKSGLGVSFRPAGYSDFIIFLHSICVSATLLVMVQFACNILANLFLFFTFLYFFPLQKWYRLALFILLICNPLYLFYSNYILSEAFFCSFTMAWLAVLLWVVQRPTWINFIAQVVLLGFVFKLRYNALFYPFFTAGAFLVSKQALWKKGLGIFVSIVVIATIMQNLMDQTEKVTKTRVFSAFAGWQLASNALNILKHTDVNASSFSTLETRQIYQVSRKYFDTLDKTLPDTEAATYGGLTSYMWNSHGPLKTYLTYYAHKKAIARYFNAWTALGPVYQQFGRQVIMNNPIPFAKYFMWPNAELYWNPRMEAYLEYNSNRDTVPKIIKDYFQLPDNKIDRSHAEVNTAVMYPWKYLFPFINALFLVLSAVYFLRGSWKKTGTLFNEALLLVLAFYMLNFFFSIMVSPIIFRYHIEIVTLCVLMSVYLLQYIFLNGTRTANKIVDG